MVILDHVTCPQENFEQTCRRILSQTYLLPPPRPATPLNDFDASLVQPLASPSAPPADDSSHSDNLPDTQIPGDDALDSIAWEKYAHPHRDRAEDDDESIEIIRPPKKRSMAKYFIMDEAECSDGSSDECSYDF